MYKVKYSKYIEKDLSKLPKVESRKILAKIDELKENPLPVGVIPLHGDLKGLYRIRSGNYRIVYQIEDRELFIFIVRIGHRKDIYDLISRC